MNALLPNTEEKFVHTEHRVDTMSVLAQSAELGAKGSVLVGNNQHRFDTPFSTYWLPCRFAVVIREAASLPLPGSVRQ